MADDSVDVSVEKCQNEGRKYNSGEIKEDEVVIIHNARKPTVPEILLPCVPPHQRQKPHTGPSKPAHHNHLCKRK